MERFYRQRGVSIKAAEKSQMMKCQKWYDTLKFDNAEENMRKAWKRVETALATEDIRKKIKELKDDLAALRPEKILWIQLLPIWRQNLRP
jgi:hypothetical protein